MDKEFDISELIITKSFDDLSKSEKEFVLSKLQGAEEYERMRYIAIQSQDKAEYESAKKIKTAVFTEFDKVFNTTPELVKVSKNKSSAKNNYKILFYIAAAAVGIIFVMNILPKFETPDKLLAENQKEIRSEKKDSSSIQYQKVDLEDEEKIEDIPEIDIQNSSQSVNSSNQLQSRDVIIIEADSEIEDEEIYNDSQVSSIPIEDEAFAELEEDAPAVAFSNAELSDTELKNDEVAAYVEMEKQAVEISADDDLSVPMNQATAYKADSSTRRNKDKKQKHRASNDMKGMNRSLHLVIINENHYISY